MATIAGPLFVDAHAHLHSVFDLPTWLTAAVANVTTAARASHAAEGVGVILLAEGRHEGAWARLRASSVLLPDEWSIARTAESDSLLVRQSGRIRLVVAPGRQIVTAERVEVLALLTDASFTDGRPLEETIASVHQNGAIAVLPWGFGKWTLERGALVERMISSETRFFLGDNGGRASVFPAPRMLRGGARGRSVLPGSDPLPYVEQASRISSYGFVAATDLDADYPSRDVRSWLNRLDDSPPVYGHLEAPFRFIWNQVRMQWRKRATIDD